MAQAQQQQQQALSAQNANRGIIALTAGASLQRKADGVGLDGPKAEDAVLVAR